MNHKKQTHQHLKELYKLLESVKQKRLGLDWQSKLSYNRLEEEIVKKIKEIEQTIQPLNVIE